MKRILSIIIIVIFAVIACGCTAGPEKNVTMSFTVDDNGGIIISIPEPSIVETPLNLSDNTSDDVTVEELTFVTFDNNCSAVLITPDNPKIGVIWVPGAGVPAAGHISHLIPRAKEGIATVVVDVRGNGGKSQGYPLDMERDFNTFAEGKWPQQYLIYTDCISAKNYLVKRFGDIPVYIIGESNGGRYAAITAAIDPSFDGYVGISTSGYERIGDNYEEPARSFLLSVDPSVAVPKITPRPVIICHASGDDIIPISDGEALSKIAGENAEFITFNGTHGINGEIEDKIINILLNISDKNGKY